MTTQTNQLKVVPVAGRIGAEIQGVTIKWRFRSNCF